MTNLIIKTADAKKAFAEATADGKKLLQNLFGTKHLYENICDVLKTYEDACNLLERDPQENLFINPKNERQEAHNAIEMAWTICEAMWEGVEQDWSEGNTQKKWFIVWNLGAGFGLSHSNYFYVLSDSYVGSRLCFPTDEKATYVAKTFTPIFEKFINTRNK